MNKILDVVEDIKQNITDSQYKTITESLMEIEKEKEEIVKRQYYIRFTKEEFDETMKIMVKLAIDSLFEYTEDDKNILYIDIIKDDTYDKLSSYGIGFIDDKYEEYLFEILKENNTINHNNFIKKIKYRK
jgi:hypothetical protein